MPDTLDTIVSLREEKAKLEIKVFNQKKKIDTLGNVGLDYKDDL